MMQDGALVAEPAPRRAVQNAGAFAAAGATGLVVNTVALAAFTGALHVHYLLGVVLATQCSTLWNFVLVDRLVFSGNDRRALAVARRYLQFAVVNNIALTLRGPMVVVMVSRMNLHYLVANAISLALLFGARYLVADKWIWRSHPAPGGQPLVSGVPDRVTG